MAVPEANASRQPTWPAPHIGPSTLTPMWPTSPAAPDAPAYSSSSMMMPPPMPVLTVTKIMCV